eukprot:365219-Chlamydomonas_euryale.AAC.40
MNQHWWCVPRRGSRRKYVGSNAANNCVRAGRKRMRRRRKWRVAVLGQGQGGDHPKNVAEIFEVG